MNKNLKSQSIGIGIIFGVAIGLLFGVGANNIPIGIAIGIAVGALLGATGAFAKDKSQK